MNIPDNVNRQVGRRVKQARENMSLRQEDIANHLHTTDANISRKESGKIPFTIEELFAVAELLERKVSYFLDIEDPDDWAEEGQAGAYFNGLPPDMQPVVLEMIKAAHREAKRRETTVGRKAE